MKSKLFLFSYLVALIVIFFKLGNTNITDTLWAEDGVIFINEARTYGINSIWKTYAGYFHVLPRIVAYLAVNLNPSFIPYVFFMFWLVVLAFLIYVLTKVGEDHALTPSSIILITILSIAQPNSGEVFFTITNAQWMLGCTLALLIISDTNLKSSRTLSLTLVFVSLTGPFSLIFSPLVFMRLFFHKDFRNYTGFYTIILTCALLQGLTIFLSQRITKTHLDTNYEHWINAIFVFASFGSENILSNLASLVFWISLIHTTSTRIFAKNIKLNDDKVEVIQSTKNGDTLYFFTAILLIYGTSLIANMNAPHIINPLGGGDRYFFIPYFLLIFFSFLAAKQNARALSLTIISLTVLCYINFTPIHRSNMQYASFTALSKTINNVAIPINPLTNSFPSWSILPLLNSEASSPRKIEKNLEIANSILINVNKYNNQLLSSTSDPNIIFNIKGQCDGSEHIGINVNLVRNTQDIVQLFWSRDLTFSEIQSMKRFYPAGNIDAVFAIPYANVNFIRIDPQSYIGDFLIHNVSLTCIES
jgi:hypothetical protein